MRTLVLLWILLLATASAVAQDSPTPTPTEDGEAGEGSETPTPDGEAPAPADCPTTIRLVGKEDLRWYVDGAGSPNPRFHVCPDAAVTFTIAVEGRTPHDFAIQTTSVSTPIVQSGGSADAAWQTPAEGTFTYICNLHGAPMSGRVIVSATPPATGGGGGAGGAAANITGPVNGETVPLGETDTGGIEPCAEIDVPIAADRPVVGGARAIDYARQTCSEGGSGEAEVLASGADLVLPVSWAVIALGIIGVVWVHKYYKP